MDKKQQQPQRQNNPGQKQQPQRQNPNQGGNGGNGGNRGGQQKKGQF